jgi:predicted O-methyltransferase YrrM
MENYTTNWFSTENYPEVLGKFKNKNNLKFLEIGSFEGMSANYFCDNFLTGKGCSITCIDPWIKYGESTVTKMDQWDNIINEDVYFRFLENTDRNRSKIKIIKGLSQNILPQLQQQYHFIFIDGDHSAKTVWNDAVMSFNILNLGGIIIFDDYLWYSNTDLSKSPKSSIDRFLEEYKPYINYRIAGEYSQVIVEKVSNF